MESAASLGGRRYQTSRATGSPFRDSLASLRPDITTGSRQSVAVGGFIAQIAAVFLAYFIAGKLGQATTNIRSSNLGPVWPAYGIALAAFLAYGYRVWPGIAVSAFLVALSSPVPALGAAGQAAGATIGALAGTFFLRRIRDFDPHLPRLRDAIGLIAFGAFGSALVSASAGIFALYATGVQAYSGLVPAWMIYWLGDSTGVLLVTPLVFTLHSLFVTRPRFYAEGAVVLLLLIAVSIILFGDLVFVAVRLRFLSFAVLPFVMWAAIDFGIGGAALSVFLIATIATLSTALGLGPFAGGSPFLNAVLLDVYFVVLAVSALPLAAAITERERAKSEREELIREQITLEARLRLAAIVESSNDAIFSKNLDGTITSWNAAAQQIFGFAEDEAVGRSGSMLFPPELRHEASRLLERLRAGERIERYETVQMTKDAGLIDVSLTISPIMNSTGALVGAAIIARDITEQNRARDAISSISRRLIHAQEEERARIARELHDDIGQRLAMLTVMLAPRSPDLQQRASDIAAAVQALSHELHSPKLDILGLVTVMRGFCDEFARQQSVVVDFETSDVPEQVPSDISLCLYRVLQEALHNSAKHSRVRHFEVRLWGFPEEIHLLTSDAGEGFDLNAARASRGLGLVSMEERLKLVGGNLLIETQPSRGTKILARAPFRPNGAAPARLSRMNS